MNGLKNNNQTLPLIYYYYLQIMFVQHENFCLRSIAFEEQVYKQIVKTPLIHYKKYTEKL